ncbi:hypothetical protein TSTA_017670 [Talaromyces stipitatus ATCC 10500]|uniref:Zn(2)-C6 fungal-type domain-containing protein n=1 Tax=Talaromyces stipitatus (strain ATCC 10500 / CBS 375.48 / QM 6759 / NRRL 1006) TaxID=441959 RepID=B8MFF9_TALSN|nr:uncharacterized protein TSTA_017670 [Talaromyces stipitatus ATCC 10500]EED16693.1 hypothetical protein TSTA_017670 [Talaromyces stipitatus ATCC 10500]
MPNTRRKACQQCRSSKARCSLALPCSRCVDRGLSCHYPTLRIRDRNKPQLNILPDTTNCPSNNRDSTSDTSYRHSDIITDATSLGDFLQPTELIDWNDVGQNGDLLDLLHTSLVDTNFTSSGFDIRACGAVQASTLQSSTNTSENLSSFVSALNSADTANNIISETTPRVNGPASTSRRNLPSRSPLLRRGQYKQRNSVSTFPSPTTTAAKTLTHKVLRGQIRCYPEMMIRGVVLPHFIHPQCVLRDQSVQDCISDSGAHSCLPESLAICASLMHMFFTKSETSSEFVRSKIYEELCRLHREHTTYDVEALLAAFQASIIYVLVHKEAASSASSQYDEPTNSMLVKCAVRSSTFSGPFFCYSSPMRPMHKGNTFLTQLGVLGYWDAITHTL